jgi:glycosidase
VSSSNANVLETIELFLPGWHGHRVDLVGDFPDFRILHPCTEDADGHRVRLQLGAGVYRYKFLVDLEHYVLPDHVPVSDASQGYVNGVIEVGRPPGHVRWAPDRRHIWRGNKEIAIRAELLDDVGTPERAVLQAGGTSTVASVNTVCDRGGHRFLSASFPAPPADVDATVTLGDSTLPVGEPAPVVPDWARGMTLYSILVDRWYRSASSPPDKRAFPRHHGSTPSIFYGGDLPGVREHLPALAELGVTGVMLTPVHVANTPHRYDAIDPLGVDERLGGTDALAALCADADQLGLKVMVDLAITHVNHRHAAFVDVLDKQQASAFTDWFKIKRFPVRRRDPSTFEHYFDCHDLPWLNLENAGARAHAIDAARRLVDCGVHGLRLDAMLEVPIDFWGELRATVRQHRDDLLLLGEVVGDYPAPFLDEAGADVVTDYREHGALLDFFVRGHHDAASYAEQLQYTAHRFGAYPPWQRVGFLDTLDTARFLSLAKDPSVLRRALATLLFFDMGALLTYGTEEELAAFAGEQAFDGAWAERLAMARRPEADATRAWLGAVLAQRQRMTDDGAGRMRCWAEGDTLVAERSGDKHRWQLRVCRDASAAAAPPPNDGFERVLGAEDRSVAWLCSRHVSDGS